MSEVLDQFQKDFPFSIEIPVQWGEMDAFNHVNNVVYYRYFESARVDWFNHRGLLTNEKPDGVGPIIAKTECRYKYPLSYPDSILIGVRTENIGDHDFEQQYAIYSKQQNRITTTGNARVVMLDYRTNSKHIIDADMRHLIQN